MLLNKIKKLLNKSKIIWSKKYSQGPICIIRILFFSRNYFRIISERDDFILDLCAVLYCILKWTSKISDGKMKFSDVFLHQLAKAIYTINLQHSKKIFIKGSNRSMYWAIWHYRQSIFCLRYLYVMNEFGAIKRNFGNQFSALTAERSMITANEISPVAFVWESGK